MLFDIFFEVYILVNKRDKLKYLFNTFITT